ncbi:unnamed protein product [Adineta ricciae]|uniref:HTH psq-type domain-containing protein n=1 Tax=Adineta ricciae TaxID=249248 RepID=A0A813QNB0_ADIRI|nr:unnamed protein product [Adineta ricciae]
MTECYSARCQQDRKLARREFNKWTKNVLLQIETISKNHLEFDVNIFQDKDEEQVPVDFNADQECLFCLNRQEYLGKTVIDDEENAPLDLSLKSTASHPPLITSNHRTNVKHRPMFDIKSDMPSIYGQEEFDRFMSEMITSQLEFSPQPYMNLNLFPTSPTVPILHSQPPKKKSSISQDNRIAQLAKQMAYERMLQEIECQRHPSSVNKKSKSSSNHSSSILTESFHVNHLLNDVMMRILHEMFEKQKQQQQQAVTTSTPQPRASRKGELLFVKKQNTNNDEQYNSNIFNHFNNNTNHSNSTEKSQKHVDKVNPPSSSSSSASSVSLTSSSSIHKKSKHKSKSHQSTSYIPKGRSVDIINNNNKVNIGNDGKQIRPKRGQYRRYESEQLAKAVAAVLSNEMSVHKAGSYFGVPHSTLEYKVKERNTKTSSTAKPKHESTSINDNDNNVMSQGGDNEDDDDDKSSKGLGSCIPFSNSNLNEIDDENDSNDADDDLEECLN